MSEKGWVLWEEGTVFPMARYPDQDGKEIELGDHVQRGEETFVVEGRMYVATLEGKKYSVGCKDKDYPSEECCIVKKKDQPEPSRWEIISWKPSKTSGPKSPPA